MTKKINIKEIKDEISNELKDENVVKTLKATTFKGFTNTDLIKLALFEGMSRGFTFKDFLEKNVYATPVKVKVGGTYKDWYSIITSIDYARKVGMRSGVVGSSKPIWKEEEGKIISCEVTVRRKFGDYIGEFTSEVFFKEFTTGKMLWVSMPRVMIAKVAEMHSLRKACPEELSKTYIEEEMEKETIGSDGLSENEPSEEDVINCQERLESAENLEELKKYWADIPLLIKNKLEADKDKLKEKLTPKKKNENNKLQQQRKLA